MTAASGGLIDVNANVLKTEDVATSRCTVTQHIVYKTGRQAFFVRYRGGLAGYEGLMGGCALAPAGCNRHQPRHGWQGADDQLIAKPYRDCPSPGGR